MRFAPQSFLLITCLALAACGSKTGLLIPDIAPDHIDATDITDTPCVPVVIPLTRRTADVMFLIDRSNSMRNDIAGDPVPPSRWSVLHDALAATFTPAIRSTLSFGAAFFPRAVDPASPPASQCQAGAAIDVLPARVTGAAQILSILETTEPGGGTPTFAAFQLVGQWFASQPPSRDPRYIVLATDGGPNCNLDLDYLTCRCTSRDPNTMQPNCSDSMLPFNCLDDVRTLDEMRSIVRTGIPIFVIGIDDPNRPDLSQVLNDMADIGGRPNPAGGPLHYYSVRQQADLANAFESIAQTIAQCTFVTTSAPASFDTIHLDINHREVPRDPTHTNGWDVTDRAAGEITLYGAVCDGIAHDPTPVISVRLGCDDGG